MKKSAVSATDNDDHPEENAPDGGAEEWFGRDAEDRVKAGSTGAPDAVSGTDSGALSRPEQIMQAAATEQGISDEEAVLASNANAERADGAEETGPAHDG